MIAYCELCNHEFTFERDEENEIWFEHESHKIVKFMCTKCGKEIILMIYREI
tara:strand:+ start:494 stop:649 length:156 start_codon:yes stop_codon:yes gene_type:complete